MTIQNGYATLAEYKAHVTGPGATLSTDSADDTVIGKILESACRYIEDQTGSRTFYPRVETRYYNLPDDSCLWLDDDLCEVITLTNGDGVAIASTEYNLIPRNYYPKHEIRLRDVSTVYFTTDSDSGAEYVIDVLAYWGYHDRYSQYAWTAGGTLAAAITTTTASTFTMTAGHTLVTDQIVKIDNEIMVISVSSNTCTPIRRGDNGSTAATHLINAPVYYWTCIPQVRQAALEIALNAYHRRFGQNMSGSTLTTAGGAVVGPQDVTSFANSVISGLRRHV